MTVKFLTGFGQRPQHLLGTAGLVSFALGALGMAILACWWIISRIEFFGMEPVLLHEKPSVIYSMGLMLLGGQLMSIGFLAELFIAYHAPDRRGYSICERTPAKRTSMTRHATRRFQCLAPPERLLAADPRERRA